MSESTIEYKFDDRYIKDYISLQDSSYTTPLISLAKKIGLEIISLRPNRLHLYLAHGQYAYYNGSNSIYFEFDLEQPNFWLLHEICHYIVALRNNRSNLVNYGLDNIRSSVVKKWFKPQSDEEAALWLQTYFYLFYGQNNIIYAENLMDEKALNIKINKDLDDLICFSEPI